MFSTGDVLIDVNKHGCVFFLATFSCQKCTNFYRFRSSAVVFTRLIRTQAGRGSLFFTLKFSWVCQEKKKKRNGRPQAKASGGSVWKNLSAFPKRFNICWMFFIFFPPLFHREEEEEEEGGNSFQRDVFLAKCCHLCAPECNCLQSLNPPQPDARVNVEKCPCVQKADVFL